MDRERRQMLAKLARGERWYSIHNEAGPVAEVRIYDEIGWFGLTAEDFVRELEEITAPEIVCAINCPGGDVFDGIAIYNALRAHPARVTTRVDSLAASVASVIVQAGDRRVMLSASQMMIHEAWGISLGTASEMREFADLLDRQSDVIAGIYSERSGRSARYFRNLMSGGEKWFTDKEAVTAGLADEVLQGSAEELRTACPACFPNKMDSLSAADREEIERIAARMHADEAATELEILALRAELDQAAALALKSAGIHYELVGAPPGLRDEAQRIAAKAAASFGISVPPIYFVRETPDAKNAIYSNWDRLHGFSSGNEVYINVEEKGDRLAETIAHELAHIAGRDEDAATIAGIHYVLKEEAC